MHGRIAAIVALAIIVAGTAVFWMTRSSTTVRYLTAPAGQGNVARAVTASGTVNPVLTIIVGSYVSGVIQELSCDYNTVVKKGQICAKIDPHPYQAALDQAKGQLARDQAQLDGARVNLARYATLMKQDSIAKQTYDDEAATVHQLEGTVQFDQGVVETATVNLGYTDIVSPVDGTVVSRNVTQGQTVAASFQTPTLFLIATDLTKMEVDTNVSESDIGDIKEGDPANFTVETFPGRTFTGKVVQVRQAPQSVQNVVTYDIVVGVDNSDLALKPGMTATVRVVTAEHDNILRVPDQALRYIPGGLAAASVPGTPPAPRLWVLRNGQPQPVTVTLGLDDDTYTEITGGELKPGDAVIVGESRGSAAAQSGSPFGAVRF